MAQVPTNNSTQFDAAIRRRATELFRESGRLVGRDAENWYRAEAEILRESGTHLIRRRRGRRMSKALSTPGSTNRTSADGYTPGEWNPGDPVQVRVAGDKLFLRRPDGRELQTSIVKRIG